MGDTDTDDFYKQFLDVFNSGESSLPWKNWDCDTLSL